MTTAVPAGLPRSQERLAAAIGVTVGGGGIDDPPVAPRSRALRLARACVVVAWVAVVLTCLIAPLMSAQTPDCQSVVCVSASDRTVVIFLGVAVTGVAVFAAVVSAGFAARRRDERRPALRLGGLAAAAFGVLLLVAALL